MHSERLRILVFSETPIQQQNSVHLLKQLLTTMPYLDIIGYNSVDHPDQIKAWGITVFPTYIVPNKAWLVDPSIQELEQILPRLRFLSLVIGKLVYQPCFMLHEVEGITYCANEDFEEVIKVEIQENSSFISLTQGMCLNAVEFENDNEDAACICPTFKKPILLNGRRITKRIYLAALEQLANSNEWCSECLQKLILSILSDCPISSSSSSSSTLLPSKTN